MQTRIKKLEQLKDSQIDPQQMNMLIDHVIFLTNKLEEQKYQIRQVELDIKDITYEMFMSNGYSKRSI